jgi:DNA primase
MAKTYIDTVKYLVYTNVDIGGLVEKPDVVGAIFGQTEGLLGDELDLRDLQKNGRIGRIEVDLRAREGRTIGTIKIPSSLDMVETSIVAASLEAVDRIGPCEANIKVVKIEDTRNLKRKVLVDRAKSLLKNLLVNEIPESKEISEMVRDEVKMGEVTEFGPERLPAGPGAARSNEIVLVEGRADVINLLKNDINNAVAIGGANVPKSMIEVSKKKEITVFLDGDRGGDIILNELVHGGVEIEFVARAPHGKEVEELTRKELIKCVRSKVPFEIGSLSKSRNKYDDRKKKFQNKYEHRREEKRYEKPYVKAEPIESKVVKSEPLPEKPAPKPVKKVEEKKVEKPAPKAIEKKVEEKKEVPAKVEEKEAPVKPVTVDKKFLLKELEELNNTLKARFYDGKQNMSHEIKVRDVIKTLEEAKGITTIVFDGIITQRLVDLAANKGVRIVAGVKIGNVKKKPETIEIVTK